MISVECVNSDNIYETTLLFLKTHGAGQCYGESFFFFFLIIQVEFIGVKTLRFR